MRDKSPTLHDGECWTLHPKSIHCTNIILLREQMHIVLSPLPWLHFSLRASLCCLLMLHMLPAPPSSRVTQVYGRKLGTTTKGGNRPWGPSWWPTKKTLNNNTALLMLMIWRLERGPGRDDSTLRVDVVMKGQLINGNVFKLRSAYLYLN